MDIKWRAAHPASALSNLAEHPFELDGVRCRSMEGWLQSLKVRSRPLQREICWTAGFEAKDRVRPEEDEWRRGRRLHWLGVPVDRFGGEYQKLLDRAYRAMAIQAPAFRAALLATGDEMLTHSLGKRDPRDTVLTEDEFCTRLLALRAALRSGALDCG